MDSITDSDLSFLTITDLKNMKQSFLYIQISNRIEKQIENGILKPGDKLASVRDLSKKQGVSISTAFKAYDELIVRGLIEARPKSGYYVGVKEKGFPSISIPTNLKSEVKPIDTNKIVADAFKKFSLEGIIKLSVTAPDISLLPISKLNKSMNHALRMREDSCIDYESISGNVELRRHIARQALQWKGVINLDEVVITHGCIESLVLSLMTVTKPGDIIAIGRPTYFSIYSIIKNLGLKILEIDIHPSKGMDIDYLERCLKKQNISACVFITNFNNPTGYCMKEEEKKKLVEVLSKKNVPLIEDDVYGDIYFGNTRPSTCKSFDRKGLVMLCSSFSKTLAPGYRVGWCLPGKFLERFLEIKLMHTVSSSSPTQGAVAHFFNNGRYDLHMNKLRKKLHIESILYRKAISDHFPVGTRMTNPKGGFVIWIELDKKIDGTEVFYNALAKGISIWPGQIFSASGGFKNFIRLSFGTPFSDEVKGGIGVLGGLIEEQIF